MEAIILAGTPRSGKRLIEGKNKFFAPIQDTYLGQMVVRASAESDVIDSIYIVGDKTELDQLTYHTKVAQIIQEKGNFYENVINAFHHTGDSHDLEKQVLILACDSPFLNPTAIEDFVSNAPEVDFVIPYCLREDIEDMFPRFKWPYLVYREGQIRLGNLALAKPNKIRNKKLISRFHDLRKVAVSHRRKEEFMNVPRVAFEALKWFGFEGLEIVSRGIYLKYICPPLGLNPRVATYLSLERISRILSRFLECEIRGIRSRYPELCFDIDNETTDLSYATQNYQSIIQRMDSR